VETVVFPILSLFSRSHFGNGRVIHCIDMLGTVGAVGLIEGSDSRIFFQRIFDFDYLS
jgi:hypothetical protein